MDFGNVRESLLRLRRRLMEVGVRVDVMLLFGSRARGTASEWSDWDVAVVSRDFGYDRFDEGRLLSRLAFGLDLEADLVPVGLVQYLERQTTSPLLHEIKKDGIPLF